MDASRIGQTTAQLMDVLEAQYDGDETAEVTEVLVCCSVATNRDPDGNYSEAGFTVTHFRASDPTVQHQIGMVEVVRKKLHLQVGGFGE